ncbi:MAG: hypothetical protein HC767_11145 [Akkermansiaceae bacterium]|nr:hypothetical protein [Akkermansiaceae bacterium]
MPPHILRSERPLDCVDARNVQVPSIGLSDLMNHMTRFIALRAMLVSDRSVGAVDFLTNLIALWAMLVWKRSVGAS